MCKMRTTRNKQKVSTLINYWSIDPTYSLFLFAVSLSLYRSIYLFLSIYLFSLSLSICFTFSDSNRQTSLNGYSTIPCVCKWDAMKFGHYCFQNNLYLNKNNPIEQQHTKAPSPYPTQAHPPTHIPKTIDEKPFTFSLGATHSKAMPTPPNQIKRKNTQPCSMYPHSSIQTKQHTHFTYSIY